MKKTTLLKKELIEDIKKLEIQSNGLFKFENDEIKKWKKEIEIEEEIDNKEKIKEMELTDCLDNFKKFIDNEKNKIEKRFEEIKKLQMPICPLCGGNLHIENGLKCNSCDYCLEI